MSYDPERDWKRFKELVEGYCERMIRDCPGASKSNWTVVCYQSFDAFVKRLSSPEVRDEVIERLEQTEEALKDAIRACEPILDAFLNKK